jgi:tetratricopeptide (TPR) repeat protein
MRPLAVALVLLAVTAAAGRAAAQAPAETARALLAAWHLEPARIDRARAVLEAAAPTPETLVDLAAAWLLTGDFRARSDAERLAAYEQGAEAARRAMAAAPRNERARLFYAFNRGRWAQTKGIMRALATLRTLREESERILALNPSSVDGLILAAGLAAEVPGFLGGDRARAEALFQRALALDPHQTSGRVELARLYVSTRRWTDAARELQRVLDETAPTDPPRWTVSDAPRARALLESIRAHVEPREAP